LTKNSVQFSVDQSSPGQFSDKTETVLGGLVQVWGGLVRIAFFSPTVVYYFSHILLLGCAIDPILFLLHSYL
jgi:hypothetical protein